VSVHPAQLRPALPSPSWLPGVLDGRRVLYCQLQLDGEDCDGVIPPLEAFQRIHKAAHLRGERSVQRPYRPPFRGRRRAS
jgi:hypothetical protein